MKKMKLNRTELIQEIYKTVLEYEMYPDTCSILWDFMCDTQKLLDFFIKEMDDDKLFIYIRQSGLETGTIDQVCERCSVLGNPICRIMIERKSHPNEFELTIGF